MKWYNSDNFWGLFFGAMVFRPDEIDMELRGQGILTFCFVWAMMALMGFVVIHAFGVI